MDIDDNIQVISWDELKHKVKKVNPIFFSIIDKMEPAQEHSLVKIKYKFGDLIIKDGTFQVPDNNHLIPLSKAHPTLRKLLEYSKLPLILLLNKSSEVFLHTNMNPNKTIPLNVCMPGDLLGTFEVSDYLLGFKHSPIWNVTAGLRNLFMLPNIYENRGIKRLKDKYQLKYDFELKNFLDHWRAFVDISNSYHSKNDWYDEIIIFTEPWFNSHHLKNESAWLEFQRYIFATTWKQTQYARSKFEFGLLWQAIINTLYQRKLNPTAYMVDTIKNLLIVAQGHAPAFSILPTSEINAPLHTIQEAFAEIYNLKSYLPTVIGTTLLNQANTVYYSLNLPILLEGLHTSKLNSSLMTELKEIKFIMQKIQPCLENAFDPAVQFDYFHVEPDKHQEIKTINQLISYDPSLSNYAELSSSKQLCLTSAFWKGCISIKRV